MPKFGLLLFCLMGVSLSLWAQVDTTININDSTKRLLSNSRLQTRPVTVPDSATLNQPLMITMKGQKFKPSPRKATMLAVVLPGAGQIYNHKYWKIPIVYAGFLALGYSIVKNNSEYITYRDAYILRYKGDLSEASYYDKYKNIQTLSLIREYYRRNRDLSVILTGAWYAITIIDAAVDAHLYTFNVTDDLSATIRPVATPTINGNVSAGLGLNLTWK